MLSRSAGPKCRFYLARRLTFAYSQFKRAPYMGNSAEVAPLLSAREGRLSSSLPRWQSVALLLLLGWLYASILARLFLQWVGPARDPNFEHGVFVPLFALFVLWQDRKRLQAIKSAPSWAG